jgi:hypothetical protein
VPDLHGEIINGDPGSTLVYTSLKLTFEDKISTHSELLSGCDVFKDAERTTPLPWVSLFADLVFNTAIA